MRVDDFLLDRNGAGEFDLFERCAAGWVLVDSFPTLPGLHRWLGRRHKRAESRYGTHRRRRRSC